MLLSIAAIVALFTLANITYQFSSDNRNQRLDNLQSAVARQLATVSLRQQLEGRQKEILVLDALQASGEGNVTSKEVDEAIAGIDEMLDDVTALERYINTETATSYNDLPFPIAHCACGCCYRSPPS